MAHELKNMIDNNWNGDMKLIADKEYLATFPNKQILEALYKSTGLELALYKILVTFSPSTMDPVVSSTLQNGWVQLFNVPDQARNADVVTTMAELAGKVVVVDEVSLIRVGPSG